jgi:argininosuccinate lyase
MDKDIYRVRIEKPLNKEILNFISSIRDDLWIAEEDIIGTEAHNIMLFEQNLLNKDEIKKILTVLENLRKTLINNQFSIDDEFEDIHPFIEKLIIDKIGIEIGGKIHTGRSRNDQVAVDIRLKIRSELNRLSQMLLDLIDVLFKLSEKNIFSFMPLYTHLQKGQLGTFSHYINNYISQLLRSLERIEEVYHRINKNPLGACAIGGTSININRRRTTELLGLEGIIENSIDAISSRDYIYETLICLSLIAIQFSRMAEDLLLWSTDEFKFVELDDQFCSVSSVMPQKKNPDSLELIRSKSSKIISNEFSAALIIKSIPSGYSRDFQDLKTLLKDSFDILFPIINIFKNIFNSVKVNESNMIKAIKDSYILALDIAEYLVQYHNIPFRLSHQIIGKLIKDSKNPEDIFNKTKIEKLILDIYKKKIILPESFGELFKNLRTCLENRKSEGSPSPVEINKTLMLIKQKKKDINDNFIKRIEAISFSEKIREKTINKLIL